MDVCVVEIDSFERAVASIRDIGPDPYAVPLMANKAFIRALRLKGVDNRAANIVKQEMLSLGGEAAVSREASTFKRGTSDLLILATRKQYAGLLVKLARQPFGLPSWGKKIELALSNYSRHRFTVRCGPSSLLLGKEPLVMGILNVTPDSFSDGGDYRASDDALRRAEEMASQGAGIIDIGGESTRPGARRVPVSEELRRIIPVIQRCAKKLKVPISVDTYKPEVARAALEAGAKVINDITALRHQNGAMAGVVRKYRAPVILMHMQGTPRTMQMEPRYRDVIGDIGDFFSERVSFAVKKGIAAEQIILDPGIGFGKTLDHNLEILRRIDEFRVLGFPLAAGTSRKSFVGKILGDIPPRGRLAGSLSSGIWAALKGVHILRVHDVKETAEAINVLRYIRNSE